jgi:hypothetical protein
MRLLVSPVDPTDTVLLGDRTAPRQVELVLALDPEEVTYRLALEVIDGRPACREFRVLTHEGGRGIRSGDLTAIKVDEMVASAYAMASRRSDGEDESGLPAITRTITEATGPRYRRMTPDLLSRVAQTYRSDTTGRPTQAVAEAYGIPHPTAARWVYRARKAGHLPPTTRGQKT